MSVTHDTPGESTHDVATLRVFRAGRVDAKSVCGLLRSAPWLGEVVQAPDLTDGTVRYLTDLVLPLPPDGRLLSLRKAALVDVGQGVPTPDGCEVPIAWRSASLAPLFPVFAGRIVVKATGLSIEGHYAPPGGALGFAADRVLLHTAARGTARWLLDHLVAEARSAASA
jgi:hypothetical protein